MFLKQTTYKPRTNSQSSATSTSPPPETPAPETPEVASKPRTSSQTWEDRRFMWQKGNERDSGRKSSFSAVADAVQKASPFAMSKPNTTDNPHPTSFVKNPATSPVDNLPSPALRDRHVIWSKGREVHEPVGERRKSSASSASAKSGMLASLLGYPSGTGK